MKLGIKSKLFLAISTSCIAIAVAMGVAVRWSFESGFIDYLDERHMESVRQLAGALQDAYAKHGSWTFVTDDRDAWRRFIAHAHISMMPPPPWDAGPGGPPDAPSGLSGPPGPPGQAWPPRPPDAGGPPPLDALQQIPQQIPQNLPQQASQPIPQPAPDARPAGARPDRFGRLPPFTLYDAQKRPIAGTGPLPPPDARLWPLTVAGRTVGWLGMPSPADLLYTADRQFQVRQLRATWIIVALAALLAAAVAMVLARVFLSPIRRLVDATHRLASGDYTTRVPEGSGDELERLAQDFNRLAAALGQAERTRRNFIADISHELRTPLAVLRGELEAIEDGVRHLDRASLASLQNEVAMLSQLIDDLYELSLADIGALSFEKVPVDAAGLVESAADAFEERLNARGLTLEKDLVDTPAIVLADPHRLTQLLKNLLENALRYTDAGGKVRVSVSLHAQQLHIDVQDSYPGVPDPLLPHLFERLFRVDVSRSRRSGGAGLGLALCRHIAEAHHGTIDAVRSPFGGVWIRLRLPLERHHD